MNRPIETTGSSTDAGPTDGARELKSGVSPRGPIMSSSTEVPVAAPSTNGELINRVQQLRLDDQLGRGAGRAGRGSWLPWVLCGLMAVAWVGVGVRYYRIAGSNGDSGASGSGATTNAGTGGSGGQQAGQPAAAPGELLLHLKGTITPALEIKLSPDDVSGVLERIDFKEGDRVRAGKTLAWIRKERYQNDYNSAKAAVLAAEAQVDKAKTAVATAQSRVVKADATLIRMNLDLERARNNAVTAKATLDEAEANQKIAEAEMKVAKSDVETSQAALAAATAEAEVSRARMKESKRLLDNCEVKAPINGTILTKMADKGTVVSPMSFQVAPGICSMADLSKLEVEIDVPERQITRIRQGLDCTIQADADPNRIYRGVLDRVMPIADDTKNVVKIRVKVFLHKQEEPGSFLKPKMSVVGTVYNREFQFDPDKDQAWDGDVK
jgi:HlyD family secretion protein